MAPTQTDEARRVPARDAAAAPRRRRPARPCARRLVALTVSAALSGCGTDALVLRDDGSPAPSPAPTPRA